MLLVVRGMQLLTPTGCRVQQNVAVRMQQCVLHNRRAHNGRDATLRPTIATTCTTNEFDAANASYMADDYDRTVCTLWCRDHQSKNEKVASNTQLKNEKVKKTH